MAYRKRIVDDELAQRLSSTGAVVIEGPKACGKTSTARQLAASGVLLDVDEAERNAMAADPALVLAGAVPRLIDEVCRARGPMQKIITMSGLFCLFVFSSEFSWGQSLGLGLEIRPFLRNTSALSILSVPSPIQLDLIAQAREIHEDLGRRGHVLSPAEFHWLSPPLDAEVPAYVEYDFVRGVCQVFLGEKAMRKEGFQEEFAFQFMVYHELAHCHLFAHPRESIVFPQIGGLANRMLSDFIQLEYLKVPDAEDMRAPAYFIYHENYADAKASALLLAEGWSKERILEIANIRGPDLGAVMGDSHESGGMFGRLLAENWGALSVSELDRKAREITDTHSAANILSKRDFVNMLEISPFSRELSDLVAMTITSYRYEGHTGEAREFIDLQKKQAAASSHPVWQAFFAALRAPGAHGQSVETFFQDRYKASADELAAADEDIRRAFAAMRQ